MRAFPAELAIMNLLGKAEPGSPEFMTTEEAWQLLREEPVDFGDDLAKWAEWIDATYTAKWRAALRSQDPR